MSDAQATPTEATPNDALPTEAHATEALPTEALATETVGAPLPVAGWYADHVNPAVLRYWDGTQWTAHTSGVPFLPVYEPPALDESHRRRATWIKALLGLAALTAAWGAAIDARFLSLADVPSGSAEDVSYAPFLSLETEAGFNMVLSVLATCALALLCSVWFYQAAVAKNGTLPTGKLWFLQIGWFIPGAAYVLPFLGIRGVFRSAAQRVGANTGFAIGLTWWVVFVLAWTVSYLSTELWDNTKLAASPQRFLDAITVAATVSLTAEILTLTAACLGVVVITRMSAVLYAPAIADSETTRSSTS